MDEKKKKRTQNDEDYKPIREIVREYVIGNTVTAIMTFTTLFALFGDDLRIWFASKDDDVYFFIALAISLVLFTLELLLQSCVLEDFAYSFYFWLDFVATLSLILDVPWLIDFIKSLLDMTVSSESMNIEAGINQ